MKPRAVKPWTWRRALRDHGPDQQGLLLTLYTLGTFMDDNGFAYPGQQTLAHGARASVRTIRRHMEQAQKLGWVEFELAGRSGQGWRRYIYRCAVPDHVPLGEKDEMLADAVASEWGNIKRADTLVSSPSPKRADTLMAAPSPKGADTCGQSAQKRADIGDTTCGQAGGPKVRTKLSPMNSRSETHASNSRSHEGAALPRHPVAHAIPDERQRSEEIERNRRAATRLCEELAAKGKAAK